MLSRPHSPKGTQEEAKNICSPTRENFEASLEGLDSDKLKGRDDISLLEPEIRITQLDNYEQFIKRIKKSFGPIVLAG